MDRILTKCARIASTTLAAACLVASPYPASAGADSGRTPQGASMLSYGKDADYGCSKLGANDAWYRSGVPYPCVDKITPQTRKNREIYHDMMHSAWVKGDLSILDKYVESGTYDYSPLHPPETGTKGFAGIVTSFRSALSEVKLVHTDMAEGNLVTHFWKLSGIHSKGPLFGVAATGKPIELSGISTVRIKDGKVVDRWSQLDIYGLLLQLGLAKPMK